jgi:hypothetical protein
MSQKRLMYASANRLVSMVLFNTKRLLGKYADEDNAERSVPWTRADKPPPRGKALLINRSFSLVLSVSELLLEWSNHS